MTPLTLAFWVIVALVLRNSGMAKKPEEPCDGQMEITENVEN